MRKLKLTDLKKLSQITNVLVAGALSALLTTALAWGECSGWLHEHRKILPFMTFSSYAGRKLRTNRKQKEKQKKVFLCNLVEKYSMYNFKL